MTPEGPEAAASAAPRAPGATRSYDAGDVVAGKYELRRLLGEGAMGSVWLARNTTLDIDVALKLIRRERATPEAARRLLQEARAAARLVHPSIVRVFEYGETEAHDPFIVMEVVLGRPLSAVLAAEGRMPPLQAVRTLLPVASALSLAHANGIVHRDVKPEHILLCTDATGVTVPKVVDFGIAKLRRDEAAHGVTREGAVLGSPGYMSPEQARGAADVDERSDVWALSVVLYELLTGVRAFDADNYNALIHAILTAQPTPTTRYAAGDDALWAIIERGLAKDKSARWRTMRELGVALAEWTVEHGAENDIAGTSLAPWLAPPPDASGARAAGADPAASARRSLPDVTLEAAGGAPSPAPARDLASATLDTLAVGPTEPGLATAAAESRPRQRAAALVAGGLAVAAIVALVLRGEAPAPAAPHAPTVAPTPQPAATAAELEPAAPATAAPATAAPAPATAAPTAAASGPRRRPAATARPAAVTANPPAPAAPPPATPVKPAATPDPVTKRLPTTPDF